jgi:hypothetical protein
MPLRIGFDLDGVLADFASAFHAVETRLFGTAPASAPDEPGDEEDRQSVPQGGASTPSAGRSRTREAIWRQIASTEDFWTTLQPTDAAAVRRIHDLMLRHRWEVFFITQRPATRGDTVQRQTQRWLVAQGFDLPSVLVIAGSRGAAAGALRLDYLIDDSATNCLDVLSDSSARPILIVGATDSPTARRARSLGIGVAGSIGDAIDLLEQTSTVSEKPRLVERLAAAVGWQ